MQDTYTLVTLTMPTYLLRNLSLMESHTKRSVLIIAYYDFKVITNIKLADMIVKNNIVLCKYHIVAFKETFARSWKDYWNTVLKAQPFGR